MQDDAIAERLVLQEVELDRDVLVVEERSAGAEHHGVNDEQELVQQVRSEQLSSRFRPADADSDLLGKSQRDQCAGTGW